MCRSRTTRSVQLLRLRPRTGAAGRDALTAQRLQMCNFEQLKSMQVSTKRAPQKIVQHWNECGALVSTGGPQRRFVIVRTAAVASLSVVEKTTAKCLSAAVSQASPVSRSTINVPDSVHAACADAFSRNVPSVRTVAAGCRDSWRSLKLVCEVHRTLDIKFGRCPQDAVDHKKSLDQYVSPMIQWRSDRVHCHIATGTDDTAIDRQKVEEHMTAGLIITLCATQPERHVRHRWTGCEAATDDVGVLERCHRLLSTEYKRFATASWALGASDSWLRTSLEGLVRALCGSWWQCR